MQIILKNLQNIYTLIPVNSAMLTVSLVCGEGNAMKLDSTDVWLVAFDDIAVYFMVLRLEHNDRMLSRSPFSYKQKRMKFTKPWMLSPTI